MNEYFYYRVIKNWLKASLVLHTHQLKEGNEKKLKQNAKQYRVNECSLVEVQLAVWWVEEDLWWEHQHTLLVTTLMATDSI